ncbi:MAG: sulfatase-like hydrolase/transferase, partial [Anaerolineae bacterium]|nr:sulfatase-like hydrolase/transferase [Anaerolineae bacterium]
RETTPGWSVGGAPEYTRYLQEKGVLHERDDFRFPEQPPGTWGNFDGRVSRLTYEDSPEGWTVRETIGFMARAVAEERPFIAHCSFVHPHSNYAPSEPFWSMYDESKIMLPPNMDYDMSLKPPNLRRLAEQNRTGTWTLFAPRSHEAGRLRKLHGYLGCVSQVDHAVGELMAWLREQGLEENTIVVYTTDHGDYACEHDIVEKAPGIGSDAITRIPYLWRWPGHFRAGHMAMEIAETVDLPTTLCTLAGLDPLQTGDGKDLSHLLRGEHGEVHKIGVTEFAWSKSVRKGRYRYVYYAPEMFPEDYPDGNFGELYDLESDPWEMGNLYFRSEYASVIQGLKNDLLDWLITTTRPATTLFGGAQAGDQAVKRYNCLVNRDGKFHPDRFRESQQKQYLRLYL